MRYTYQQLEIIRERALALGLMAELDARPSDPDEPFLSVRLPEASNSISYFLDLGRLTSVQAWGDVFGAAVEIDKLHAMLAGEFAPKCDRCGAVLEDSERGLCARCDSELSAFWASAEAAS